VSSLAWACAGIFFAAASLNDIDFSVSVYAKFGLYVGILVFCGIFCAYGTTLFARLQTPSVLLNVALALVTIIGLPIARRSDLNTAQFTFGGWGNLTGCTCSLYIADIRARWLCLYPQLSRSRLDHLQLRLRRLHF
jgi:hypothetical protein